ncbi:MAG: DNA repair exonuclease [Planctomycetota bacterium]
MSNCPFRFVHSADFHLELPPFGVSDVPDHLRELFLESAYLAAERVFETVLAEEAEFLLLSGDLLDPRRTGPRGLLFLAEQFGRLAEREIAVYWAGGEVDPPDAWPAAIRLPENVCVFPPGRLEEHVHQRDGTPLARVMGTSRASGRGVRASEFAPDPAGLFSIAVVHGAAEAEALQARGIDYWALGGSHARHTLFSSPHVAHYPGSPQGRHPGERGPHGCTLVHVDPERGARTTLAPTDLLRWQAERIVVEESTTRGDLERQLHERMQTLVETTPGMDLLVEWAVVGSGPLLAQLRRAALAEELLEVLRAQYGFGPPAAWSLSLVAEPTAVLPPEWYEQQTIRGDFLRELRHFQMNPSEPLDLEPFLQELADEHLAGTTNLRSVPGCAAQVPDGPTRDRVLREAAMLGVDLLSGEEPEP